LTPFWNIHCVPTQGVNESGSTPTPKEANARSQSRTSTDIPTFTTGSSLD
jgi:hypothetical protein